MATPLILKEETGVLEYWSTGVSKNWSNGVLEYWSVGKVRGKAYG
jgi:hypothetical protein